MAESQPILAHAAPQSKCLICEGVCPPAKGRKIRKFCSPTCDAEWRRRKWTGNKLRSGLKPVNSFVSGQEAWNKGVKGTHFSPATEFKNGHGGTRRLAVGSVTIRNDKNGKPRAWVKISDPNRWRPRAVIVWEATTSRAMPRGSVVHHIDRDTLNDEPSNLELQTRAQHILEHRAENEQRRRDGQSRHIATKRLRRVQPELRFD